VIESKSNFIEHPDLVAQRIARYANLVGRNNVIAGSDCGFGTWVGQAAVDSDIVWAKLASLAEGARLASRELWEARGDHPALSVAPSRELRPRDPPSARRSRAPVRPPDGRRRRPTPPQPVPGPDPALLGV